MDINDLVKQIRFHVNDYTVLSSNIVDELPATGKLNPHDSINYWNSAATGIDYEEFLTKGMPLVSGNKMLIRGGRWAYTDKGEWPGDTDYTGEGRVFLKDYARGMIIVPSGATPIVSGEKVKMTYSWWEDQEYRFSDTEIKTWIPDGDSYIREKVALPYKLESTGNNLAFSVFPSGLYFSLLALSTSYFIRRRLEEEGFQDGIFVKDGDTAFDTTKTLVHRGKTLKEVKGDIDSIIMDVKMADLITAGIKLDTYSTRDRNWPGGVGSDQENNITGFAPFVNDGSSGF